MLELLGVAPSAVGDEKRVGVKLTEMPHSQHPLTEPWLTNSLGTGRSDECDNGSATGAGEHNDIGFLAEILQAEELLNSRDIRDTSHSFGPRSDDLFSGSGFGGWQQHYDTDDDEGFDRNIEVDRNDENEDFVRDDIDDVATTNPRSLSLKSNPVNEGMGVENVFSGFTLPSADESSCSDDDDDDDDDDARGEKEDG